MLQPDAIMPGAGLLSAPNTPRSRFHMQNPVSSLVPIHLDPADYSKGTAGRLRCQSTRR